ncbi:hypothetical protein D3C85_1447370 [compost metagenome]
MGATAGLAVLGRKPSVMAERGALIETPDGARVLLTLHPAFVLRVPDPEARRRAQASLVEDLKMARREAGLA